MYFFTHLFLLIIPAQPPLSMPFYGRRKENGFGVMGEGDVAR